MVCMHTADSSPERDTSSNDRLRALIEATALTQAEALARFNRGMGLRPIAMSTWKGYFVKPDVTRKLLAQRQWRGVLQMRATDLDDAVKVLRLPRQRGA